MISGQLLDMPTCDDVIRSAVADVNNHCLGTALGQTQIRNHHRCAAFQIVGVATAQQMQIVARMIDASSASGVGAKRQVFFVSIGGFDSHDNENRNNADLMARLAHAMRYFDSTLVGMGAQNKVTAFTASGRSERSG